MGKGDKKTAKGKRVMGSYGVSRKKDKPAVVAVEKPKVVKAKAEPKPKAEPKAKAEPKVKAEAKPKAEPKVAKAAVEKKTVAKEKSAE